MVSQIYPSELQLNKANTSDTEAAFLDLHLSFSNDIDSTKIYDNVTTLILKLPTLLRYSVLFTVESLSLLYLLFISWFIGDDALIN